MPKICEPCEFYSADNAVSVCPKCGGPVKMTMLPPRGVTPTPLKTTGNKVNRSGGNLKLIFQIIGIVIPVIVSAGFLMLRVSQRHAQNPQVEQISLGMPISEAAKIIDTGKGMNHPDQVRFRDRFMPGDRSTGRYTLDDGKLEIVLHWKSGFVTALEQKASSGGGMRRETTKIFHDGEDDGDDE